MCDIDDKCPPIIRASLVPFLQDMESPLPSQSNMSIGHPSIFVDQDGSPIQIFTEACSIKGRPKLMRTLRVS